MCNRDQTLFTNLRNRGANEWKERMTATNIIECKTRKNEYNNLNDTKSGLT